MLDGENYGISISPPGEAARVQLIRTEARGPVFLRCFVWERITVSVPVSPEDIDISSVKLLELDVYGRRSRPVMCCPGARPVTQVNGSPQHVNLICCRLGAFGHLAARTLHRGSIGSGADSRQ